MLLNNLTGGLSGNSTPRDIKGILKQTKFNDVQNLWSENGILKTQAGQEILAKLPDDFQIKHIARTNQNNRYIYIIGEDGDVYIYNRGIGLKRYKTVLGLDIENLLSAQYNNNLVLANQGSVGGVNLFGGYYDESDVVNIMENVTFTKSGNIITTQVTPENIEYFWRDKVIAFVRREGGQSGRTPIKGRDLKVTFNNRTPYDDYGVNGVNIYGSPDFSNKYMYTLDNSGTNYVRYPDFVAPANGQKWCVQFKTPKASYSTYFLIQSLANKAFASVCLKNTKPATNNIFGLSLSSNGTSYNIANMVSGTANIDELFKSGNLTVRVRFTGTQYLVDYSLDYNIETKQGTWINDITVNSNTSIYRTNINPIAFGTSASGDGTWRRYYDNIEICYGEDYIPVYSTDDGIYSGVVLSTIKNKDDDNYTVSIKLDSENILSGTYNIAEKALHSSNIIYAQEGQGDKTITINNLFIAQNRLFVEDVDNWIYYSQVGVFDNFDSATGAGSIYNFYNDNSRLIDIEEFTLGILITRANGIYRLTFGNTVQIEQISNVSSITQGEHIAINDKIIGFDNTSKSILEILKFNFLGSLTAGKILLNADNIIENFPNIMSDNKYFSYNSEYNIAVLYMGEKLNEALVLNLNDGTYWKRVYNDSNSAIRFINGDIIIITEDGYIKRDFDRYSVINDIEPYVELEPISGGLSTLLYSKLYETLEYTDAIQSVSVNNDGYDIYSNDGFTSEFGVPDLIYSDAQNNADSFELQSKWASNNIVKTKLALNGSGASPLVIRLEFKRNIPVTLFGINLVDFGVRTL